MSDVLRLCYDRSIELLKANSSSLGILASGRSGRAVKRSYLSVFSRDASICALGMIASRDPELLKSARISLENLAKHQALNGQIPNHVKAEGQTDFWRVGCIDATLWWLLAVDFYARQADKRFMAKMKKPVRLALQWLMAQEHPQDGLVMQNEASDWADIMPRSGKVLYSNSLWALIKDRYGLSGSALTKKSFNDLFFPFDSNIKKVVKCQSATVALMKREFKSAGRYISFANYLFYGRDLDVLGNSLALLAKMPKPRTRQTVLDKILGSKKKKKMPMPVLFDPITTSSPLWRRYMASHRQNYPGQYHNGGIWPFAACFWAMALFAASRKKEAKQEMELIARANQRHDWEFNEWFNAKNGKAMGMKKQSWNAGAYLLAYHCIVKKDVKF